MRDYTCGFRAYRVSLLRRAFDDYGESFVDQQGFQCMADILLKLRRYRPRIGELPFVLRYDRKAGSSKMKLGRTTWSTLRRRSSAGRRSDPLYLYLRRMSQ